MNKLLFALILFSANSFADLQYDLDKMQQDYRQQEIEKRIDDLETQRNFDNAMKEMDNNDLSIHYNNN